MKYISFVLIGLIIFGIACVKPKSDEKPREKPIKRTVKEITLDLSNQKY